MTVATALVPYHYASNFSVRKAGKEAEKEKEKPKKESA